MPKECLAYELKVEIEAFSLEDIKNIIANELKKHLKLQLSVQMVPKEEILSGPDNFGYKKNLDYKGMRFAEGNEQASNTYLINDPSKFSFAGV